ncbi:MAG: helix-turn-helix domain-containing protein [Muribaculaceae bacterium]|nr:helix-turn-helix domain-containing protein [Muribaculaceae bacterium]
MIEPLTIRELISLKHFSSLFTRLGDDYIFAHILPGQAPVYDNTTIRFDGIMIIHAVHGEGALTINMENVNIRPNILLIAGPNSIINAQNLWQSDVECYTLFVSTAFIRDINFEMNLLHTAHMVDRHTPILNLDDTEATLISKYFELIHLNTRINNTPDGETYARSISRNIIASLMYQLITLSRRRQPVEQYITERYQRSHKHNYARDFIRLVQENFRRERSVSYYADRLFISSKYLSLVIKEITGRSAASWIDDYVILEAKNLLRYSGKNVQQVAYELNFSNQSSFGKYFKHLTGMSPSAFQRG